MQYKHSKFNFIYVRKNGEYVIYNTYSKALVLLDKEEFLEYKELSFHDPQTEQELVKNGILLEELFDEIKFLTYCHNLTKYSKEALHLVIATTMDCNFGCPYCYENRRKGRMSQEVQDAIIQFINSNVKNGIKECDVTWYGGEPLLYPDIIQDLCQRIRRIMIDSSCELKMYMVTNGFLFTRELIEMIDKLGILKVQITLDGLKEHHNVRRPLKDGKGTFERIFENLKLFEEYSIKVDIRMNVDNENCGDYIELQKKIEGLDNSNIMLYPSPVEDINPNTINKVSDFMSFEEFESFAYGLCKEADVPTVKTNVLDDRYCYCQAETENSYVIDELGYCYKCWDQVGRIETACFNIKNMDEKNYSNIIKFLAWDPFKDPKCKDCKFLPVCFGGCKFHRINKESYDCGFTDESMKSYLEETFFND